MPVPQKNEKKLERAFEVIEKLEKSDNAKNSPAAGVEPNSAGKSESVRKTSVNRKNTHKSGIHIHLALDALISEDDTQKTGSKEMQAGTSKLINVGVTIPHIWKIPVIGRTALKIVRHFQVEKHPETIRDILCSLQREKKPR